MLRRRAAAKPLADTEDRSERPAEPAPTRRAIAVCEDLPGALRISRYLSELQGGFERQDLGPVEALERLSDRLSPEVDLVIFAPAAPGATSVLRAAAQELVTLAAHQAAALVVLPAPGPPHGLTLAPSVKVVELADPAPASDPPRRRGFSALLARLRPGAGPLPPPLAASLPEERASEVAPEAVAAPLRLMTFQPLAGGAGGTTLALLSAAEIVASYPGLRVLLIDLDLQFGEIGGYLDQSDNPRITDLYSGLAKLDLEAFRACLVSLTPDLQLLAAPPEILPLDALDSRRMLKLLGLARASADLVILDLPHAVPDWLDAVWREADLMISVADTGVRSSHSHRRLQALSAGRAFDPRRAEVWLNGVPAKLSTERAEELESLAQAFAPLPVRRLPDGGPALRAAQMQGVCARMAAPRSVLVAAVAAEIRRLAPRLNLLMPPSTAPRKE